MTNKISRMLRMSLAVAGVSVAGFANAATPLPRELVATHHVVAGDLDIGYAELGPADGEAVILLHEIFVAEDVVASCRRFEQGGGDLSVGQPIGAFVGPRGGK